jgi:hypothetical protein
MTHAKFKKNQLVAAHNPDIAGLTIDQIMVVLKQPEETFPFYYVGSKESVYTISEIHLIDASPYRVIEGRHAERVLDKPHRSAENSAFLQEMLNEFVSLYSMAFVSQSGSAFIFKVCDFLKASEFDSKFKSVLTELNSTAALPNTF